MVLKTAFEILDYSSFIFFINRSWLFLFGKSNNINFIKDTIKLFIL